MSAIKRQNSRKRQAYTMGLLIFESVQHSNEDEMTSSSESVEPTNEDERTSSSESVKVMNEHEMTQSSESVQPTNAVWGTSSGFGKCSLKHSTSFQVISSIQKLARKFASTLKVTPRTNSLCCFATPGTSTAGSVTSRGPDVAINWQVFPPN